MNELSFEEAYSRLEKILEELHNKDLTLEKSLAFCEEADKLIQFCHKKLAEADKKIALLSKNKEGNILVNEEGHPIMEDYSKIINSHKNATK